jgi:alkane 1-monooxygenase
MWRAASSPQHCPIERSRNPAYAAGMSAPAAPPDPTPRAAAALPFWISLLLLPLLAAGAWWGGRALILLPLFGWFGVTALDALAGRATGGLDPDTPADALGWYRAVTVLWVPLQFVAIFGSLWWVTGAGHLSGWEKVGLFFGVGVCSGTIGINYAHELMHQRSRLERWLADILLAMVLYSHFRSEHLLVHHPWVGTPRDPVTARYNEGFHRFFGRVLRQCPASAFRAEAARQRRAGRPVWHRSNPFWRYAALQAGFLALAVGIGGPVGLGLFLWQALVAIWQLELVNYIEHYGLTREYLGDGRYEPVRPRHSWNADHRVSNWLLINLQRHSDHHYKPDRRFPLLQTYGPGEAPQLPFGYPAMTVLAMIPPLWRRAMNPRVRAWRRSFYPAIADWSARHTNGH